MSEERDTIRPPSDPTQRLMLLLEEVSAAAANLGSLVTELKTAVAVTQLAMLTYEHQVHNAHDRVTAQAERQERQALEFELLAGRVLACELAQAAE